MKKYNFSEWAQISHACFWWWFKWILQVWWNLVKFEKMLKFHDISRAGTVSIFLWNKSTSLKWLKFHMHVSYDDSNMFCKFDEIWWTLKKCWNFMIFQRAGTVVIFLWNKSTFLNWLKFYMHVSDDDSNMFCKFDEIWWTLKKCWNFMIFLGPALSAFFCEKYNFSEWAQISHACFWWWFKWILQVWWNLVNFEKRLKFHDISKGRHCQHFSIK